MGNEVKKIEHMYEYKVGDTIRGDKIAKIYFANDEKKYIIIGNVQEEIKVYGEALPQQVTPLLAQCSSLAEFVVTEEKLKKRVAYEKALAINEALLGNIEKSEEILLETIEKIKQSEIVKNWKLRTKLYVRKWSIIGPETVPDVRSTMRHGRLPIMIL